MKWVKKNGHWLFFGAVVLLTLYMDVYVAKHFPDGDASQLLWHGWLIAREGNPFTNDLYHTTEPRLFDIATVFAFFFGFLEDWTLVRILGTVVAQAVYVFSFLYLCKQSRINFRAALISAGLLLLPFSTTYARIVLYHLHYILYFSNAFWMIGLTLRLADPPEEKIKKPVLAALLAGLWLLVGLNGVRHMMILGVPMLIFTLIQFLQVLQGCQLQHGRLVCEKSPMQTSAGKLLVVVLGSCVCFLIGYGICQLILLPHFHMDSQPGEQMMLLSEPMRYVELFRGLLVAAGVRDAQMTLMSVAGVSLVTAMFSFGYLFVLSFHALQEEGGLARRLSCGLMSIAFLITLIILVFESGPRYDSDRFFIPVLFLAFPLLAYELNVLFDAKGIRLGRLTLCVTVCICLVFQSACTVWFLRVDKDRMDRWNGLTFQRLDVADELNDCAEFLQQSDYTHAMINYWWAAPLMEMTDGVCSVAALEESDSSLALYKWGTFRKDFSRENAPDRMLLFIRLSRCDSFEQTFPDAVLVHDGYAFRGYEIDTDRIEL